MENGMPIGVKFSVLHRAFKRSVDEQVKQKGLTGVQFGVLAGLSRLEQCGQKEIRQRDLEQVSHVTHSTMTEIIKRLENKEFLVCHTGITDRRSKIISSTKKTTRLLQEMDEIDAIVFQKLSKGLNDQQKEEMLNGMNIMIKNAIGEFSDQQNDIMKERKQQ